MWDNIDNSLREAARQAKAMEGTAWGAALGGLIAMLTEGSRFARTKSDKLSGDINSLKTRLTATEGKLDQIFTPQVSPGSPSASVTLASFTTNGGTISISGDDRNMRVRFDNGGAAVGVDQKLARIQFGKEFVGAPKVVFQKVGRGGTPSDDAVLYPDQPTSTGFDIYVGSYPAAERYIDYDILVMGPQQKQS